MTDTDFNSYDFMINSDNEVMLLLYAQQLPPQDPLLEIDEETFSATLYRDNQTTLPLCDVPEEVITALQEMDNILICELNKTKNAEDTKIVHTYEAKIANKLL